jgi:hypothetical protein
LYGRYLKSENNEADSFIKTKIMIQIVLSAILLVLALYLVCGIVFTFFFIARGLEKVDEDAPGSSWGFRIIIIPGCILLWPMLLRKWVHALKI